MSAEKLRPARVRARLVYDWMGRYPRKGADWSPEEDQVLVRAYESGRYLTKEIAARHLREPAAIERRLDLLRKRAERQATKEVNARYKALLDAAHTVPPCEAIRNQVRNWQTERETAQQAIAKIKGLFSASMWPRVPGNGLVARAYAATHLAKRPQGKSRLPIMLRALKPGDLLMHKGEMCVVQAVTIQQDATRVAVTALTDLPPEVAQALQFGGES